MKMLPPATTLWWVPAEAITDREDLLLPETYNGGTGGTPAAKAIDLSCAVVTGYTLNPTDSDTDSTASICDEGNVETPIRDNYEASVTFFREAPSGDVIGDESTYDKAFRLFKDGRRLGEIQGYFVERLGWKRATPVTDGHVLSIFLVVSDNPRNEVGDAAQPIQFTVPFLQQGWMRQNLEVGSDTID